MKRRYFLCTLGLILLLVCSATGEARAGGPSPWHIETVDSGERSGGRVGGDNSLALDSLGRPHISYFDDNHGDLKYAYRTTTALLPGTGGAVVEAWWWVGAGMLVGVGLALRRWGRRARRR
jgi:hypothetical protein